MKEKFRREFRIAMGCSGRRTTFSPCHSVTAMSLTRTPKFRVKTQNDSPVSNLTISPASDEAPAETVLMYNMPTTIEE